MLGAGLACLHYLHSTLGGRGRGGGAVISRLGRVLSENRGNAMHCTIHAAWASGSSIKLLAHATSQGILRTSCGLRISKRYHPNAGHSFMNVSEMIATLL